MEGCKNYGPVQADLNAGGIVGAVAIESDLDPEADVSFSGDSSLNFAGELRAVILGCRNSSSVTGKKQNIGGGGQQRNVAVKTYPSGCRGNHRQRPKGGFFGNNFFTVRLICNHCTTANIHFFSYAKICLMHCRH